MDLGLEGRTALVTGASQGLGYACALALAQEGARVALCSRDPARIETAAEEIATRTGAPAAGLTADLTDREDLARLVKAAQKELGAVDIVVVSTGHPPNYSLLTASDAHWQAGFDLTLQPAITLSRSLLPHMCERGYGRFIFIGSIFSLEPEPSSTLSSTLRSGLNALAKCIATENAARGVTANVICPGYFETPLLGSLAQKYADETGLTKDEVIDDWTNFSPTKTLGRPEDLGALVAFLGSPRGAFITGTTITMDGGALHGY
jgi:3-oxoacyl-[acyl-carrier protein] reductase